MKYVRVQLENGAHSTVSDALARRASLKPLDPDKHPAVNKRGKPLPDEFPAESADTGVKPPTGENRVDRPVIPSPQNPIPPEGS